jgi:hypothetical protein
MSEEVELERLVVRLMGDGSDYSSMMNNAQQQAEAFHQQSQRDADQMAKSVSGVSDEMANAAQVMGSFDSINRGTGRSLSMLGRTTSQFGLALSMVNPALGQSVSMMGILSSTGGQATRTILGLNNIVRTLGASIAANPFGWAAGGAMLAGAAVVGAAYKMASKEISNAAENSDKLEDSMKQLREEEASRVSKEIRKEEWLPEKASQFDKAESDARKRYNKALNDASIAKAKLENIHWYSDMGMANLDKPIYSQQLKEAREAAENAKREMVSYQEEAEKAREAYKEFINEQSRNRLKGMIGELNNLESNLASLVLTPKAAAWEKFSDDFQLALKPNPTIEKGWNELWDQVAEAKVDKVVQDMSDSMVDLQSKSEELLDPLNSQLRITNAVAKAARDYAKAHNDIEENIPKAILGTQQLVAHQQEYNRMIQEGASYIEKFKEPLDRMIDSQKKLGQIQDAGGFGKGVKGIKIYDAYAQAHKDYTVQFKSSGLDALVVGTSEYEKSLQNFKLATTAIPRERKEKQKTGFEIQTPKEKLKFERELAAAQDKLTRFTFTGPESSVSTQKERQAVIDKGDQSGGLPFGKEIADGTKDMAQLLRELVDQGKKKSNSIEIPLANL